jgi:uncharacterized membrane protein
VSISKNTEAIDILLLKFRVMWSSSPHTLECHTVICSKAFSKFLSSVCFWIVLKISFSNSLPIVDKRLIGCKFWGHFGSFAGFWQRYDFCFLPRCWEVTRLKAMIE